MIDRLGRRGMGRKAGKQRSNFVTWALVFPPIRFRINRGQPMGSISLHQTRMGAQTLGILTVLQSGHFSPVACIFVPCLRSWSAGFGGCLFTCFMAQARAHITWRRDVGYERLSTLNTPRYTWGVRTDAVSPKDRIPGPRLVS